MASVSSQGIQQPDSISVLQQQLHKVQALKRSYCELQKCFLQHASSLSREQELKPAQKRTKDPVAQIGNQEGLLIKQKNAADIPQHSQSLQSGTEETVCEDSGAMLLTALKQGLEDLPLMARLEQSAASSLSLDQDRMDACAVLTGRKTKYYVHQTTVSVGRSSVQKGQVDIDLSLEGAGTKLSRYSCFIDLDMRYGFVLHNIARQTIMVNNVAIDTGKKAKLPHLSLIEISGVVLLFQTMPLN